MRTRTRTHTHAHTAAAPSGRAACRSARWPWGPAPVAIPKLLDLLDMRPPFPAAAAAPNVHKTAPLGRGYMPLHLTCKFGGEGLAQQLLDAGAQVDGVTEHGKCTWTRRRHEHTRAAARARTLPVSCACLVLPPPTHTHMHIHTHTYRQTCNHMHRHWHPRHGV